MDIGAWDVASVVTKAVTYGATLSAAGGAAFVAQHRSTMSAAQGVRVRRWLGACVGVALLATIIRVGVLAGSMGDDVSSAFDGTLVRMVLDAGEGRAAGLRIAGLLAIAASLALSGRFVALGGAILAATSFAWVGHAWAASHGYGPIAVLSVHLGCVAFWLGALVPLRMAAREDDLARLAALARSFGVAAAYVVAVLIAAGVLLLAVLLSAPSDLWTTEYGQLVAVKLGVVTALLGVAALNRLRLTPRLLASDRTAASALRRSIEVEIALALTVLLLTASFTTLVGPASVE